MWSLAAGTNSWPMENNCSSRSREGLILRVISLIQRRHAKKVLNKALTHVMLAIQTLDRYGQLGGLKNLYNFRREEKEFTTVELFNIYGVDNRRQFFVIL